MLLFSAGTDGSDLVLAVDVIARSRSTLARLQNLPELPEKIKAMPEANSKLEARAAPLLRNAL